MNSASEGTKSRSVMVQLAIYMVPLLSLKSIDGVHQEQASRIQVLVSSMLCMKPSELWAG